MVIFLLAFNSTLEAQELTKELYFHLDQGLHGCGNDIVDIRDGSDGDDNDEEGGMCFTIHYTNVDIFKFILGSKA